MARELSPEYQAAQDEVNRIAGLPSDELIAEALVSVNGRWEAQFHYELESRTSAMAADFNTRIFADPIHPNHAAVTQEEVRTYSDLQYTQGRIEEIRRARHGDRAKSFIS